MRTINERLSASCTFSKGGSNLDLKLAAIRGGNDCYLYPEAYRTLWINAEDATWNFAIHTSWVYGSATHRIVGNCVNDEFAAPDRLISIILNGQLKGQ